ncbi:hypothetical protein IMCC1933_05980 [Rhodobacteraceae bacterium IMCC1933]|nr:hypothetical protein [Rhodobacteraceae bacterium IMCC1923]MDP4067061.1 hypothetical protein [Rhodobacteraceae bacterium IMCC1933]MDP4071872.1 hypothetical protein [Rhodobacteraceae bacterium IMCC1909]
MQNFVSLNWATVVVAETPVPKVNVNFAANANIADKS